MAYKIANGQIQFIGKASDFVRELQLWYYQDFGQKGNIDFNIYMMGITTLVLSYLKGEYANKILKKGKIKIIDSLFTKTNDNQMSINLPNAIDFIAESVSKDDIGKWGIEARKELLNRF